MEGSLIYSIPDAHVEKNDGGEMCTSDAPNGALDNSISVVPQVPSLIVYPVKVIVYVPGVGGSRVAPPDRGGSPPGGVHRRAPPSQWLAEGEN